MPLALVGQTYPDEARNYQEACHDINAITQVIFSLLAYGAGAGAAAALIVASAAAALLLRFPTATPKEQRPAASRTHLFPPNTPPRLRVDYQYHNNPEKRR